MSVPYIPESSSNFFKHYYESQAGGVIPIFRGSTRQRGYGLGSIFRRAFRGITPLLKSVAKTAGKQLISTGANIANDLIDGEKFGKAALSNLSSGGRKLIGTLTAGMTSQKRGGAKRRRNASAPSRRPNKTKRRRLTKDIFK